MAYLISVILLPLQINSAICNTNQDQSDALHNKMMPVLNLSLFTLFAASFDHDNDSKTFIRGGKPTQGSGNGDVVGGRAGDVYKLDSKKAGRPGAPLSEMDRMLEELKVVQQSSAMLHDYLMHCAFQVYFTVQPYAAL